MVLLKMQMDVLLFSAYDVVMHICSDDKGGNCKNVQ